MEEQNRTNLGERIPGKVTPLPPCSIEYIHRPSIHTLLVIGIDYAKLRVQYVLYTVGMISHMSCPYEI